MKMSDSYTENKNWQTTFLIFWIGQASFTLTSSVLQMSAMWYIAMETGSAAMLSFATLVGFLPQGLFSPFIGVILDRHNRKTILILAGISLATINLALVFAGFAGSIPIFLIFLILFFRAIGLAFLNPSIQTIMPLIVPKEELVKCAGYSQSFRSVSLVISPALAAVLFNIWNISYIAILDIAGALFAVTILSLLKIANTQKPKQLEMPNVFKEAKGSIEILRKTNKLLPLFIIGAIYPLLFSPIGALYSLITISHFGGGITEVGIVETIFSLGMLAGSLLLGVTGKKINMMGSIVMSIATYGTGVLIIGLLPSSSFIAFIVLSAILGMANPFFTSMQTAIYQTQVKREFLGRVLSLSSGTGMITMSIGLVLSGIFAEQIGVTNWFFVTGILVVILAFVASLVLIREK
jgi:DHA3 family macrolide efflux protein-like MFS transporter